MSDFSPEKRNAAGKGIASISCRFPYSLSISEKKSNVVSLEVKNFLGVCRKNEFLCANSVMLCVSVVKLLRKTFTTEAQRSHREPQRRVFPIGS
jgi:hypothetical protein